MIRQILPAGNIKRIHVNQHIIRANKAEGTNRPVLTCKTYNDNLYAHEVTIAGPSRLVYKPTDPLSCGATVWIETNEQVILHVHEEVA